MRVFFYGLFMDESLLATKGVKPTVASVGFVDGYDLRVGERATLVRRRRGRAYGVMMVITSGEATKLYTERSVADYVSEPVVVELMDGTKVEASCFNLPVDRIIGTNAAYVESLFEVATKLGLPEFYLEKIRQA